MLPCLGFDRFVCGDHKQYQVDAAHTGQHVLDKSFMARNIDETKAKLRRQLKVSETDIDGNAAPFFLLQTVGVNAGKGLDQRGLAVVNVPRRADDDVLHTAASHRTTRTGTAA